MYLCKYFGPQLSVGRTKPQTWSEAKPEVVIFILLPHSGIFPLLPLGFFLRVNVFFYRAKDVGSPLLSNPAAARLTHWSSPNLLALAKTDSCVS
jgi:hypothetical protein